MPQFSPWAFIPFCILLATTFASLVISTSLALLQRRPARRKTATRTAEILYFPARHRAAPFAPTTQWRR
jgi:hypothetical protein